MESKENVRFYVCPICGNVVGLIHSSGVPIVCCGQNMERLEANTVDAATEKHVPVYEESDGDIIVSVGEVTHPMDKDHYIMWIAVVSDNQTTRVALYPEQDPVVRLPYIAGSTIYAYCNKHGLWKTEVK